MKARTEPEVVHAALIRIADRITPPNRWTQRTVARDDGGKAVSACHVKAVCWCLNGAMLVETCGPEATLAGQVWRYLQNAANTLYPDEPGYTAVNDHKGHEAALAVARLARDTAAGALP